jgi:hypothetical protein
MHIGIQHGTQGGSRCTGDGGVDQVRLTDGRISSPFDETSEGVVMNGSNDGTFSQYDHVRAAVGGRAGFDIKCAGGDLVLSNLECGLQSWIATTSCLSIGQLSVGDVLNLESEGDNAPGSTAPQLVLLGANSGIVTVQSSTFNYNLVVAGQINLKSIGNNFKTASTDLLVTQGSGPAAVVSSDNDFFASGHGAVMKNCSTCTTAPDVIVAGGVHQMPGTTSTNLMGFFTVYSAKKKPLPSASENPHFRACVSDSTGCSSSAVYTPGGMTACEVWSNGTDWIESGSGC